MRRLLPYCACCVISWHLVHAAEPDLWRGSLGEAGTNNLWSREIIAPVLLDTNAGSASAVASQLSHVLLRPRLEVAGVHLGMSKDQVLAIWGRPEKAEADDAWWKGQFAHLSYPASITNARPVEVDVIFGPPTNSVVAIWLVSPGWNAPQCLKAFGEPSIRNYIPNPLDPPKPPPKHWYCRMVYRTTQPATVLYFCNGELMGLEVNPQAKGALPDGGGSDDNSMPTPCLQP